MNPDYAMLRIQSGHSHIALREMLDSENTFVISKKGYIDANTKKDIDINDYRVHETGEVDSKGLAAERVDNTERIKQFIIDNANNEDVLINFGTISQKNSQIESTLNYDYNLVSAHAYAIKEFNAETGLVTIANPHNPAVVNEVPLEILTDNINRLYYANIN